MIDFTPVLDHLSSLVATGLVALAGVALKLANDFLKEHLGATLDKDRILPAIKDKVKAEKKKLMAQYGDIADVSLQNQAISQIANELIDEVPDALKKAGYTEDKARKIMSKEKLQKVIKGILKQE